MQELLKLLQKMVPELIDQLEKRYNILRTIYYNQPIGRRILANNLDIGERIVRTEISFLKNQNLIQINTAGMNITPDGEIVIDKLKDFIHEIKGLSDLEVIIKEKLGLKEVLIVPGDVEEDRVVLKELGRVAANYIKNILKDNCIVSITGGSTIKEVVDSIPKISNLKNVLAVPARGGMGRNVELQANTLVASLANKIDANYKLLHVPDNLSHNALNTILNEREIREIIDTIHNSDILIYGIGRAGEMARRRGLSEDEISWMEEQGAVGEAFGYYFNRKGEIIHSTPTIGLRNDDIRKINTLLAIAGGKSKAEAIVSIEINHSNGILITDEGAAREVLSVLGKK